MAPGLLVGVLLTGGGGLVSAQEKTPSPAPAPASSTILVELKPARLIFVDRHEVAFDRPGVLQFVVEEGEQVQKGQPVARLEDGIAKAAVGVAEARVLNTAEVTSAQKQAELAKLKYDASVKANEEKRLESQLLGPNGKAPTREGAPDPQLADATSGLDDPNSDHYLSFRKIAIDELKLTYEAATADVGRFEKEHEVNQKGLLQAQAELAVLELKAPRAGLVTRAFKQTGEGVQSGEKVLEIISTSRIRVEVEVSAVTAARLKVGMPITVIVQQPSGENAMASERYPTTLKFKDPTIGQVSKKVRVWAELDNPEGKLIEGLDASIEIVPSATAPTAAAPPVAKPQ